SFAETAGTHYYGFEVYSNKKGTIYSRNFSAVFLVNGTYDDGTTALISALQANDTYFNGTAFPNSTSFRNDTAVMANNTANLANTTANNAEPAISQGVSPQFWMFNKTWQNITTSWITEGTNLFFTNASAINAVQSILDLMNTSSATNNTASQGRDNLINSTKANKSDIGEFTGGTIGSGRYGTGIVTANISDFSTYNATYSLGGGPLSISNGTNAIAVGSKSKKRMLTAGTITALYVNQTNDDACSGNITITSSGAYKSHINWSSVDNVSKTGLSATFTQGEWLLYNMTENTGCVDLTFEQVHTKS
ncbi:MAG: hypothetical protein WC648_04920, partial [Candidatus Paceibacterota bacterium]